MLASRFVPVPSLMAFALLAAPLALPNVALARGAADDEVVSTASRVTAKPPTEADLAKAQADAKAKADADRVAKPVSTQEQIAAWLAHAPPVELVNDGPAGYATGPALDVNGYPLGADGKRQVHGEAGVSIGTGGYRSGYVSTLIPIGENGTLGLAVSQTDFGKNSRARGYGYGRGGYGGGGSQSVALSLDMRGGSSKSDTPAGCAPGFRDGDRYIEPVWVTQMRGDKACDATAERR
jgi:hypothetical protein